VADPYASLFGGPSKEPVMGTPEYDSVQQDEWSKALNLVGGSFSLGAKDVTKSYNTAWLMTQNLSDEEELNQLKAMDKPTAYEAGEVDRAYRSSPWGVQIFADAAATVPFMAEGLKGAAVGGAAGFGAGLAVNAPLTAALTPVAGAAAAVPIVGPALSASVLALPSLASTASGAAIGQHMALHTMASGSFYRELRLQHGIDQQTAKTMSVLYGAVSARLESLGFGALGKLGGKAMNIASRGALARTLTAPGVVQLQNAALARLGTAAVGSVATEATTEGMDSLAQSAAELTALYIQKTPPKDLQLWASDAGATAGESFIRGLGAALVLGAATGGGSFAVGKAGRAIQGTDVFKQVAGGFQGKDLKTTMDEAIDLLRDLPDAEDPEPDAKISYQTNEAGELQTVVTSPMTLTAGISVDVEAPQIGAETAQSGTSQESLAGTPLGEVLSKALTDAGATPEVTAQMDQIAVDAGIKATQIKEGLDALFPPIDGPPEMVGSAGRGLTARAIGTAPEFVPVSGEVAEARLNQIASDRSKLTRERRTLEREMARLEETGRSVTSVRGKLEAVIEADEVLRYEEELIDSRMLSADDIGSAKGQLTVSKIAKMIGDIKRSNARISKQKTDYDKKLEALRVTAKTRMERLKEQAETKLGKKTEEAQKRGDRLARASVRTMQAQLKTLVNAATEDRGHRAQLYKMIAGVTTPDRFDAVAKKMQYRLREMIKKDGQKAEQAAKDKVLGEIEKVLSLKKFKTSSKSGYPTSQLDADTTARIGALRQYVKKPEMADAAIDAFLQKTVVDGDARSTYEEILAFGDTERIPDAELVDYQIAVMAQGMDGKSEIELRAISAQLAQWISDGLQIVQEKKAEKRELKAAQLDIANASIQAIDAKDLRQGGFSAAEQARQMRDSLFTDGAPWNALMEFFSPKDPTHALAELLDVTPAKHDLALGREIQVSAVLQDLQAALESAGSDKNILDKAFEDETTDYGIAWKTETGKLKRDRFTKAQLIDIYMKMQDETLHGALREGNGITFAQDVAEGESFQEQLEQVLTEEDIAVADALFAAYDRYHERVNGKYREKFNADLPKRAFYSPVERTGVKVDPVKGESGISFSTFLPGSARTRTSNKYPIKPRNAYQIALDHIDQWERFFAYDGFYTAVRNVFSDPGIRGTIRERHGHFSVAVVDNYVDAFVRNDPMNASAHPMWGAMRSALSKSALGFQFGKQVLQQLTSGTAYWAEYSPVDIMKGYGQFLKDAAGFERIIRSSPILKKRYAGGASVDFASAVRGQGITENFLFKLAGVEPPVFERERTATLSSLMFSAFAIGDAAVARAFGAPVYYAELAAGKSPEQALLKIERLAEETQQSSEVDQVPNIYRRPEIYTLLGQFTLQSNQLFAKSAIAVRDFIEGSKTDPNTWLRLGRKLMGYWVVPGAAMGAVRALPKILAPPESDDDREREVLLDIAYNGLLGPAAGAPVFGDVLEFTYMALAAPLLGLDKANEMRGQSTPVLQLATNFREAVKAWSKLLEDGYTFESAAQEAGQADSDVDKALGKTARALGPLFGVPMALVNVPIGVAESVSQGDWIGAALAKQGWTPASIRERWDDDTDLTDAPGAAVAAYEDAVAKIRAAFDQGAMGASSDGSNRGTSEISVEDAFIDGLQSGTLNESGDGAP
jgi:hypothetical protein